MQPAAIGEKQMKRILVCCMAALTLSTAVSAMPVACNIGTAPVQLTVGGASPTFPCGGLAFSNFQILNMSGSSNSSHFDINGATFDSATGWVVLNENPGLGPNGHVNLFYQVTGPLIGIDLSVGGENASVIVRACASPVPRSGELANLCTNVAQTGSAMPLAQLAATSATGSQPVFANFGDTSTIYIFKDIMTGAADGLSTLNESFHTTPVPEPLTMLLVGSALAGLAFIRRRPPV
jgi:hypothetical protein